MMNTSLWGSLVTVGFVISFVSIALWAYWPSNKDKLQAHASIPLSDEDETNAQAKKESSYVG